MAHALTALRLLLALPIAAALAGADFLTPFPTPVLTPVLVAVLITVALVSDYIDGPIARATGTASPRGQLFDHGTDCFFVTVCLAGAAIGGSITPLLPALIPFAFAQYVVDSYVWGRQKQLRASLLGRWNGILYFVPIGMIAGARLPFPQEFSAFVRAAASLLGYALVVSTLVSIVDRATTPARPPVG